MLHHKLAQLEAEGKPIKVGIVGSGRMGSGVAAQIAEMAGLRVSVMADLVLDHVLSTYRTNDLDDKEILVTDDLARAAEGIADGLVVATTNSELVSHTPVDVVVEATGLPEVGARVAYDTIAQKKHIVMLNVETDVVVGSLLKQLADQAGVVYTVSAGDEPGAAMGLYEYAVALGFRVVCAGKGPMRPIRWDKNPETVAEDAHKIGLNPKMLASFWDGSKHNIEMTALANATGLVPDVRGMHVPTVGPRELARVFSLKEQGGILNQEGVVELAAPFTHEDGTTNWDISVTPGVFVVYTTDNPHIKRDLAYLAQGEGPNYVWYRHYHLCDIETPYSIARAYFYHEPTIASLGRPTAETLTVAKRDLRAGEILDGSGGFTVTGQIERAEIAGAENILPLGLAYDVPLVEDAVKGQPITYDMVALDDKSFVVQLRRLQDSVFWSD